MIETTNFLTIAIVIFDVLIGVVLYLLYQNQKNRDKQISDLKIEINHTKEIADRIKDNYLTRFELVNANLNSTKIEIINSINELRIEMFQQNKKL